MAKSRELVEWHTILWFAGEMGRVLKINRPHKSPWEGVEVGYLLDRLREEVLELEEAIGQGDDPELVITECVDTANFAMMIADKARAMGGK